MMLNHIRIVLVEPSHPGNIGASARAMKTMGFSELVLVNPREFPHPKAEELASNAGDVVKAAKVVATMGEAIKDCHLVVGASARVRAIPWPLLNPRELGEKIISLPKEAKVAILFGREDSGLTNDELTHCHVHMHIPANPAYSSLNLAAAVQVVCYELRMAHLAGQMPKTEWDYPLATVDDLEKLFDHFETVLTELDFLKKSAPRQLMPRLRRLFLRAGPDTMEVAILRGFLSAVEKVNK